MSCCSIFCHKLELFWILNVDILYPVIKISKYLDTLHFTCIPWILGNTRVLSSITNYDAWYMIPRYIRWVKPAYLVQDKEIWIIFKCGLLEKNQESRKNMDHITCIKRTNLSSTINESHRSKTYGYELWIGFPHKNNINNNPFRNKFSR